MINNQEIKHIARITNSEPNIIEKNYVLSWVLAGIFKFLKETWLFKGGTCIKKCYFETYRFSEDLDFTLTNNQHLDPDFLYTAFSEISKWVYEKTGIKLNIKKEDLDFYKPLSCQGKLEYIGPLNRSDNPKIKLDLTADEVLFSHPVKKKIFHPYTDRSEDSLHIMCYSYEELFAEKMRALIQRGNPRDLYDVVNLYRHNRNLDINLLKSIFEKKCNFKNIPTHDRDFTKNRETIRSNWDNMLRHQLSYLSSVEHYLKDLSKFYEWFESSDSVSEKSSVPITDNEALVKEQIYDLPLESTKIKSFIELIRFASTNHLCVRMMYKEREELEELLEVYALSKKEEKHFILYAWNVEKKEISTYLTTKIKSVEITDQYFEPRYKIDIIPKLTKSD